MQARAKKKSHALFILRQTIDKYPDDFQLRPYTYGRLFQRLGLYHDAISCFKRADINNVNHINAQIEMASCFNALNLNSDALASYRYVAENDSTNVPALLGMAYTLLLCKKHKESEKVIENIIGLNPKLNDFSPDLEKLKNIL
jgi:tetratricopeptide (TPR) repeat protein